jgi:alkylation response protein AidB-like acyl-CoA dehydrogenase
MLNSVKDVIEPAVTPERHRATGPLRPSSFGPSSFSPVSFSSVSFGPPELSTLLALIRAASLTSVADSLTLGIQLGAAGVYPGEGRTRELWEALSSIAAVDLGAARAIEPHLDALAILEQAGLSSTVGRQYGAAPAWGVFAAEGGAHPLTGHFTPTQSGGTTQSGVTAQSGGTTQSGGTWHLSGTKPWCSLADRLDAALVTAHVGGGKRQLFAVALNQPGVHVLPNTWFARGLAEIVSGPVDFVRVAATPIGEAGWYLQRPGFRWGGIGVAACWFGGLVAVARALYDSAAGPAKPADDFVCAQLGAVDVSVETARRALLEGVTAIDAGLAVKHYSKLLTERVRATVVRSAEDVLQRAGHALGPAPLALDEKHAKRVADLSLYIAQHHAERDEASLGRALLTGGAPW